MNEFLEFRVCVTREWRDFCKRTMSAVAMWRSGALYIKGKFNYSWLEGARYHPIQMAQPISMAVLTEGQYGKERQPTKELDRVLRESVTFSIAHSFKSVNAIVVERISSHLFSLSPQRPEGRGGDAPGGSFSPSCTSVLCPFDVVWPYQIPRITKIFL